MPDGPTTERFDGNGDRPQPPDLRGEPHRRYNPLTDDWVLVSAERTRRPWQGRRDTGRTPHRLAYDPGCYLCPGNIRANGERNPAYADTFVFTNDFAALRPDTSGCPLRDRPAPRRGRARDVPGHLLCAAPRPDDGPDVPGRGPLDRRPLGGPDHRARPDVPLGPGVREPGRDDGRLEPAPARPDLGRHGPARPGRPGGGFAAPALTTRARRLLLDYVDQERAGPRVVVEDDDWLVVVPFWAAWPFETLVVAKRPTARLADLDGPAARRARADADRAPEPLRQPVPAPVPVLDGLAPGAVRRRA